MTLDQALKLIGASKSSSLEEIKALYRKLAMIHHPDRGGTAEDFKRIKNAYDLVSEYYKEINTHHGPIRNFSKIIRVEISLEEAFSGIQKDIVLSESPRIQANLDILPGIVDDELIYSCSAKGLHSVSSSQEELVNVTYKVHASIVTDYIVEWGDVEKDKRGDIKKEEPVSPFKMICGGWQEVDTLSKKKVSVRIPEGMMANKMLKVKGHGYWRNSLLTEQGDLYLKIIPDIKKMIEYDQYELEQFVKKINRTS
jgi:DnaJ-class molecular chaperone